MRIASRSTAALVPTIATALAALSASAPAQAQDTTQRVVVTATRMADSAAAPLVSTTVITGASLRARGITSLGEALASVAGAFAPRRGSPGAPTSLFLRAGESGILDANPPAQQERIENRKDRRDRPGTERQRQQGDLGNDDRVVGMAQPAIGTTRHRRCAGKNDDARRPALSQAGDDPQPDRLQQHI